MSFINTINQKSVADNDKNLCFWENYLQNLRALDFKVYADKLKVPTLVPIGSRIFFRGELKHTNEVTVALGADYFVKCSLTQAEVLRQHRIKDAESKVESFRKEKVYLEKQLSFTQLNVFEKGGHEIVEVFTEEEDKAWRQKHRENVRKYKQGKATEEKSKVEITDEELWNRLDELEIEEDLENEMLENYNEISDKRKENSFLVSEEQVLINSYREEKKSDNEISSEKLPQTNENKSVLDEKINYLTDKTEANKNIQSKLGLLQQVLDKQNLLEDKLLELKNRDRQPSKTEKDLVSRLDEMEQLDELEDEMNRLDDILVTEDVDSDDEDDEKKSSKTSPTKLKKSISFADNVEDISETVNIIFKHSDIEPDNEPYDPEMGISKPSDIYAAHSNLFNSKPTSILKKSKYGTDFTEEDLPKQVKSNATDDGSAIQVYPVKETIVVKDVTENPVYNQSRIETDVRPTSLFKKKRMQNKS